MAETLLVWAPGLGWLALTPADLTEARRQAAEALDRASVAIPGSEAEGDTSGGQRDTSSGLLDASEMSAATGVPASWFESAARKGLVPHHSFGRYVRFNLADVLAASPGIPRLRDVPKAAVLPLAKRMRSKA